MILLFFITVVKVLHSNEHAAYVAATTVFVSGFVIVLIGLYTVMLSVYYKQRLRSASSTSALVDSEASQQSQGKFCKHVKSRFNV